MKKLLSILIINSAIAVALSAFTWTGLVDNSTKVATSDFSNMTLTQSNGIYLSCAAPLTATGNVTFSAEGLYKYNLVNTGNVSTFTNIADVDLLKLNGKWAAGSGLIGLSAGRFSFSDSSGVVFSQSSDGIYFSYEASKFKTAIYGGYTGLLNSLNVSMTVPASTSNAQFYNLCASYIPLSAEVSVGGLFGSGNIGLQAMYFLDPKNELKSLFYSTLLINTPLSSVGTFSISATAGSSAFENLMMYAKADCSFYLAQNGIISVGAEYASGKQGPFSAFNTVTARTACNLGGGIGTSGLLMPVVSAVFVKNSLYASLTEKVVCLMPETNVNFEGFDTGINVLYNIFSDVQFGLDLAVFCDINDSTKNYYSGTLKLSLSF